MPLSEKGIKNIICQLSKSRTSSTKTKLTRVEKRFASKNREIISRHLTSSLTLSRLNLSKIIADLTSFIINY